MLKNSSILREIKLDKSTDLTVFQASPGSDSAHLVSIYVDEQHGYHGHDDAHCLWYSATDQNVSGVW